MKRRFKDSDWDLSDPRGNIGTWERVGIAVMMDIRDELKQLNRLLSCPNFLGIPGSLRQIEKNTTKKKRNDKSSA